MKKRWKLLAILVVLFCLFELFAAPFEWLWPIEWGGKTLWRGNTGKAEIALTFDDGPSQFTSEILDILEERSIQATFFVMGKQAEKYPDLIRRMVEEGHEIGNHTFSFKANKFNKFFDGPDEEQIRKTQHIIEAIIGKVPAYFRSPGGQVGRSYLNIIRKYDLQIVNGALPLALPDKSAEEQLRIVNSTLKPGAIIILHDGDDQHPGSDRPKSTVEMLPQLLQELQNKEIKVVPLGRFLKPWQEN